MQKKTRDREKQQQKNVKNEFGKTFLYPLVANSNQFLLFLRTMRATHLPEN